MSDVQKEPEPPIGYYNSALDWMAASQAIDQSDEKNLYEIYPAETFQFTKPKGLDDPVHWRFRTDSYSKPQAYVAVLPEGRFWGTRGKVGAVISPDNKLIWDVSMLFNRRPEQHPVLRQTELPPLDRITETVALLTFIGSNNYYHWMLDVLPRIDLLRKSKLDIDKYVITASSGRRFHQETLALTGIPENKMIRYDREFHLQAKRLVVPSLVVCSSSIPRSAPKWACDFLRSEFLGNGNVKPVEGYERIYVSRADAAHRNVQNEGKVMELLATRGFKKVVLRSMPVAEQVKLFASADVVVSAHGAGLTNLVFCRPGTKVVEIFSPFYMNPCFWYLSNHVGLDYSYVIGKGQRPPEQVDPFMIGAHIHVDLQSLSKTLKLAGI